MKRQDIEKTTIVLRILAKLDNEKEEAANYFPMLASNLIFQVNHKMDCLTIDMGARTCTFKKWDMYGILCCHVVSCIFSLVRMLKTLWMIFIRERHALELIQVSSPLE